MSEEVSKEQRGPRRDEETLLDRISSHADLVDEPAQCNDLEVRLDAGGWRWKCRSDATVFRARRQ